MTRTLYYITGGESTLSHRGGPGSNPNQFMWDLFWGGKNYTWTGSPPSTSSFPSVPSHKYSVRIHSSKTDGP